MTRLLIPAAIASLLLLVAITVVLAHLNWSEKLYNPLLSLAFVGTATAFVTILLPLKGSQNETEFTTSVVVDETSHTLPLIMPDGRVTRVMNRLGELSSISRPTRGTGGDTRITVQPPNTTDETFRFWPSIAVRLCARTGAAPKTISGHQLNSRTGRRLYC